MASPYNSPLPTQATVAASTTPKQRYIQVSVYFTHTTLNSLKEVFHTQMHRGVEVGKAQTITETEKATSVPQQATQTEVCRTIFYPVELAAKLCSKDQ